MEMPAFKKLCEIVAKLRDPHGGCPWDLEQSHASLKQYLIEEAYEVLDAIDNDPQKLHEELGDVLLQVMLHSQIAHDQGRFNVNDVIETLCCKLIERHPHVFGAVKVKDTAEVLSNWEAIKKKDRGNDKSMLAGLPEAMPALLTAHRIGQKVARVGFDWESAKDVSLKVKEELDEFLKEAASDSILLEEEFGDLLFTLAQLARKLELNAEDCLRKANTKFSRRFRIMEQISQKDLRDLSCAELQQLWAQAKESE